MRAFMTLTSIVLLILATSVSEPLVPLADPLSQGIAHADTLTLAGAVDTALRRSARGALIRGSVEIAERQYQARRINFYFPSVSLNGSVPSYEVDQSYKFFGASTRKRLYKTSGLGVTSFVRLQQSLVTGGDLSLSANLAGNEDRYPDTDPSATPGSFLDERSRRGYFDFRLAQPLLRPSTPRNELHNRSDELSVARLRRHEEEAALARDVAAAYMGILRSEVGEHLAADRLEAARLQAVIDSVKWQDAVVAEEAWLQSASRALEAELVQREAAGREAEHRRALALLLDRDPGAPVTPVEPVPAMLSADERAALLARWEQSVPVRKAELDRTKATRAASFAASGRGLTGDIKANWSVGRGRVEVPGRPDDAIETSGWGVSLEFSYPVWDGGAAAASVQAARFEAERARLELETARREARSELERLLDQLEVSGRRLEILRRQIDLAEAQVAIAEARFEDGRISEVRFLETRAGWLEARARYLEELETWWKTRITVRSRFGDGAENGWVEEGVGRGAFD